VEPLTRGLPPPDPRSLCSLSSTEFVEPPPPLSLEKIPGYATDSGGGWVGLRSDLDGYGEEKILYLYRTVQSGASSSPDPAFECFDSDIWISSQQWSKDNEESRTSCCFQLALKIRTKKESCRQRGSIGVHSDFLDIPDLYILRPRRTKYINKNNTNLLLDIYFPRLMIDITYLEFGVILGMWPNICIRSLRHLTTRVVYFEFQRTVERFSFNWHVRRRIYRMCSSQRRTVHAYFHNFAWFNASAAL
jgi:hypothetical protein